MLTKRVWSLFALALVFLLLAAPYALADNEWIAPVGGGCCGLVISLAIAGAIGYWVYTDATARGANGILWALIAVFVPCFIGLICYFIMRPQGKGPTP